jgi:hypothetical protein
LPAAGFLDVPLRCWTIGEVGDEEEPVGGVELREYMEI